MNVTSPIRKPLLSKQIEEAKVFMLAKDFSAAINHLTPILRSMDTKSPKPNEISALLMMADAQLLSGFPTDAYKNYVIASELDTDCLARVERPKLQCVYEMKEPILSPTFEKHLVQLFNNPAVDKTSLDSISVKLLKAKFKLGIDDGEVDFATIVTDSFLSEALTHLVLADAETELFLSEVRHLIFNLAIESDLVEELQPLAIAFANHAERIEYAFPIEESERIILLGIKSLLESEVRSETDLKKQLGPVILFGMFEPLDSLSFYKSISISNLEEWPASLQPLIRKTLIDRSTEQILSESIQSLSTITHDVSKAVMNQYEKNPYPRWENIFRVNNKMSYLDLHPGIDGAIRKVSKFKRNLDCLVAGCGTGKHPLSLAENCQKISVLALDLSLPSLSYAKRKSIELQIKNIDFVHGDILELDTLERKFDVIECSGVLHHMEDPEAGLKVLLRRLRSTGLIRIALYSQPAREYMGINRMRVDNPLASLEDIRALRTRYLESPKELGNLPRDFYSASECRDLLFHVQEHQYSIPEIKALLERNNLDFLGFNPLHKDLRTVYKNRFGPNADFLNLDDWHIFEQENPLIFKSMYQFHCQKRD